MKKIFYTMAMALLVFTGCSEEDTFEQSINPFARFSATIEQQSPVSRVEINPNNTMNFSVGDIARIFTKDGLDYDYIYDASGYFVPHYPDDEIPSTTSSNDIIGAYLDTIDDDGAGGDGYLDGNTLEINIAQSIVMENCSQNCVKIPMWATWNGQKLNFRHLAGVLRLELKNLPSDYDFLTVKTSNRIVDGTAVVEDITDPEAAYQIIENGENLTYIKFAPGTNKTVYVALPVGHYEYIRVMMSKYNPDNSEGEMDNPIVMAHYTDKTIERGKIYTAPSAVQATSATLPKHISDALIGSSTQQIMTVSNELDATADDAGHIEIPATLNSLSFDFRVKPKTDEDHPLIIKSNSEAKSTTVQKMLHIYMPDDADDVCLEIDAPNTTVTLNNGVYTKVIATTANETLIINEETTVEDALIHYGNVRVYGSLNGITSMYDGTLTLYQEIGGTVPANLPQNIALVNIAKEQFLADVANATYGDYIYLDGDITLDAPIQITNDVCIDLEGNSIYAPMSDAFVVTDGTLRLQGGNVYCNSANAGNYSVVKVNGSNAKAIIGTTCELQGMESGVTPNGCVYVGENGGTVEIDGGMFKYTGQVAVSEVNRYLINQADNLTEQCIFIRFGLFYNFNPTEAQTGDAWMTGGVGSYAALPVEEGPDQLRVYGLNGSPVQEGNDWLYIMEETIVNK